MRRIKTKHPFKKVETFLHREAVKVLRRWVKGKREVPFMVDGYPAFVADVVSYDNGIIQAVYEVAYTHPIDGRKLGMIQYWSYRNGTPLTVFEVKAEYIMKQIGKPEFIDYFECYVFD